MLQNEQNIHPVPMTADNCLTPAVSHDGGWDRAEVGSNTPTSFSSQQPAVKLKTAD